MIVTCASCLTKFNLDNSRIPSKGTKVRCSRCRHIFYIVPPPETREEVDENFESFAKYHEELFKPGEKEVADESGESFESFAKYHKELFKPEEKEKKEEEFPEFPSPIEFEKEPVPTAVEEAKATAEEEEEEETFLFSEKASAEKGVKTVPSMEEEPEVKASKAKKMVRRERRMPSLFFAIVVVLILLVLGAFYYLWTGVGSARQLSSYLEYPIEKMTHLWNQILGTENKVKVAEKETICGRIIGHDELKTLPADFFVGEIAIKPKTEKEMIALSGKTIPFMVIFKYLSNQAREFTVEIVEAPNL
jgi:predicted Zn finger-like uncharacterized protein